MPAPASGPASGAQVAPGTGDNMAAALGLGLRPGDLALSLGTSGTAFTVSTEPSADPTGTVAGFADATGHYLPLVCTMNATKVTDAVARLLGLDHATSSTAWSCERPPERVDWCWCRISTANGHRTDRTRPAPFRACAPTSTPRTWCGRPSKAWSATSWPEPMCSGRSAKDGRVFLIGGAARSPAYRRVVADLLGRVVEVPSCEELVAGGAAVQAAAVHLGCDFASVAEAWGLGRGEIVEPDDTIDRVAIRSAYAAAAERAAR